MAFPTPVTPTPAPVSFFGREPIVIIGAVQALLAMLIGFGLNIDPKQFGLIMVAMTAVMAMAARSQVSPMAVIKSIDPALTRSQAAQIDHPKTG